jgi:hypothetical protein
MWWRNLCWQRSQVYSQLERWCGHFDVWCDCRAQNATKAKLRSKRFNEYKKCNNQAWVGIIVIHALCTHVHITWKLKDPCTSSLLSIWANSDKIFREHVFGVCFVVLDKTRTIHLHGKCTTTTTL